MNHLLNTCKTILGFVMMVQILASCSSSRHAEGFQYRTNVKTPDIGSGSQPINRESIEMGTNKENNENDLSVIEFRELNSFSEKMSAKLTDSEKEKMNKITEAVRNEYRIQLENGTPMSNRDLTKKVTDNLVSTGTIEHLSKPDMKKLDRLAAKVDKKRQKQGKDIDVANNTNLELFFLIMGIAGLVLGILGVWIGWLLFVVFGGLYLYYKLVKD